MKEYPTGLANPQSIFRSPVATHGINLVPSVKPARKIRNSILGQLPVEEHMALAKHLVPVSLPTGMMLSEPNQPIEFLYFVESGLISTDALTSRGEQVEIGLIGREGFSGLAAIFDQPQMSHVVMVQGKGEAYRIRASLFRAEFSQSAVLQRMIHSFAYLQMVQITQSVLCNRMHEVEQRLARWLLASSDRLECNQLQLTQEAMSQMLGVQRSTVTVAAGDLQRRGMISYSRGRIEIVNRAALAATACECYSIVNASYERVLKRNDSGQLMYCLQEAV